MKEILIILDGLMEESLSDYSFKDLILGDIDIRYKEMFRDFAVEGKDIDSLNCIMNILGYNSNEFDIGERAYYEGLNKGIVLKNNEIILRCNIVKVKDGILKDFTGGNLTEHIDQILQDFKFNGGRIYPCYKYKNLLILNQVIKDKLYPPHFYIGEDIKDILPKSKVLKGIVDDSYEYFKNRGLEGLMLWPWGISKNIELQEFPKKSAVISGIDLVLGIGKALGMNTINIEGCTGDIDTNLKAKLGSAIRIIEEVDFLLIHINGFDELAHRKDLKGKIRFINKVKKEFLVPLMKGLSYINDLEISITCDHWTDSFTGKHVRGNSPVLLIKS